MNFQKKIKLSVSIILVFSGFLINAFVGFEDSDQVIIVAHRGAMTEKPENTLIAFRHAITQGADIVEIDLWTSSDGYLFILHDPTLDRTTNGTGYATDYTIDELQNLDAGSWFGERWTGERIPSFKEVLQWATEEDVILLLDLKEQGHEFAERVSRDVKMYGIEENMIIGVRTPEQALEFKELLPNSSQLAFMRSPDLIEEYARADVEILRLWLRWLDEDPRLAERVRNTGKKLMINGTTGCLDETEKIMSFFPDWVLIDDVEQLKNSLDKIYNSY